MAFPVESTLLAAATVYALLRGEMWVRRYLAKKAHAKYHLETAHLFHPKHKSLKHTIVGAAVSKPCHICGHPATTYHEYSTGTVECFPCTERLEAK